MNLNLMIWSKENDQINFGYSLNWLSRFEYYSEVDDIEL